MIDELSDDETQAVEIVERFAREVLAPRAAGIDENETFATVHLKALAELGVLGLNLPTEWGGAGVSGPALYKTVEAIAGACSSTASMVTAHFLATDSLLIGGGDLQRKRYLPKAAAGETLGAFALTEPQAGSNPADMTSYAERTADGYHLRGVKHFISNAGAADFILVFAKTNRNIGARGISAFIVDPAMTPGVEISEREKTMGLRGGHVFEIRFDCRISAESCLGTEGNGFRTAMKVLDNGRIEVAAQATGIAKVALDAAIAWVKQRKVGGRAIAEFQGLQWMLADMAIELAAARALGLAAANKRASGARFSMEAAYAKLFATEAASRIADKALQIHGGYGYTRAMPLERYVRDLRVFQIYEGSSEVQRNIIARGLLA